MRMRRRVVERRGRLGDLIERDNSRDGGREVVALADIHLYTTIRPSRDSQEVGCLHQR